MEKINEFWERINVALSTDFVFAPSSEKKSANRQSVRFDGNPSQGW